MKVNGTKRKKEFFDQTPNSYQYNIVILIGNKIEKDNEKLQFNLPELKQI